MRVGAPGKLLLTGSYSVLEGAPAIACAISRLAVASEGPAPSPSPEVLAAIERSEAPAVDVSQLFSPPSSGGQKLGLGSSAAAVVAALGYVALRRGDDLSDLRVRRSIFERAREAHARVQSGGSGVDIAASTYGGVLRYRIGDSASGPLIDPVSLPADLRIDVYASGQSVRTSDMRARVDALKARDGKVYAARLGELTKASLAAASAVDRGDARGFIEAARATERGLSALGRDADAPIVPLSVRGVIAVAESEESAFLPSGAGGGDVFVRIGTELASSRFVDAARELRFEKLDLAIDVVGVRILGKVGESSS